MPLRQDIKKVLVIGSGPIIIGQAAEFDYAGTQACRALKEEGLEVVLINSNPATIMTDKAMADHIYIEPLTLDTIKRIITDILFKACRCSKRKQQAPLHNHIIIAKFFVDLGFGISNKALRYGFAYCFGAFYLFRTHRRILHRCTFIATHILRRLITRNFYI